MMPKNLLTNLLLPTKGISSHEVDYTTRKFVMVLSLSRRTLLNLVSETRPGAIVCKEFRQTRREVEFTPAQ